MTRAGRGAAVEMAMVALVAAVIITIGWWLVGDRPFARQAVVWVANVAMLLAIWAGLRLRGQTWEHYGLRFGPITGRAVVRTVLLSLAVLVVTVVAFLGGSVLGTAVAPAAPAPDMSGYDYLRGNLPMLLVALVAVYVVSSFGEEVVYRGFLVTRAAELGGGSRTAWGAAVVVSGVVFGLVHFEWGLAGIVQTTLMGLALAAAYLVVRRRLWVLVLAHAYMDTVLLVQLYLSPAEAVVR